VSTADFEELLAILDLNRLDDNTFVGSHPSRNPVRTFGGQMMAQAFVAGSRTVLEKLRPSALSVHFIAGGDPEKDLEFHVLRLRDERRFANRRVDVMQNGELLTTAIISYMNGGSGIEHGIEPPELPDPESVPSVDDLLRGFEDVVPHFVSALRPIDWRYTNDPSWVMRDKGEHLAYNRVWMKAEGAMPDDPVLKRRSADLLVGHHRARLDHHHARPVVGFRPHLCGDHEPLGLVPPPGAVRRMGVVLDLVAGCRGLARPRYRAFLRPIGAATGDRGPGRNRQVFPGRQEGAGVAF